MEVAPFFVDFHHFLSIFTIYALLSRFTFCRDLRTFSAIFFGQNCLFRHITRFLHVCMTWIASIVLQTPVLILIYFLHSFKLWIFNTFGSTPALRPMNTARMYRLLFILQWEAFPVLQPRYLMVKLLCPFQSTVWRKWRTNRGANTILQYCNAILALCRKPRLSRARLLNTNQRPQMLSRQW